MTDLKCYLPYLKKVVDQSNNLYHHSISRKPIDADYSALIENIQTNPKPPKFMIESKLLTVKIFLVKAILKIGQEKYFLSFLF